MQNDLDKIYYLSKGLSVNERDGVSKFNKAHYKQMKRLTQLLSHENSFEVTRDFLCDHLGITNSNLLTHLNPLVNAGLIEYETCRMNREVEKGNIKIYVNPAYVWGYSMRKTREQAIKDWYLFRDLSETSKTDITLSPSFQKIFKES